MPVINYLKKKINYEVLGEGKAIVLLHGFTESISIWNHYAIKLAEKFKVVTIDLPGHGNTEVFEKVHSMDLMANHVYYILKHLHIDDCIVMGHSMGGYVSFAFAKRYPEMLKGLCLLHSHAAADTEEAKENRDRTIELVNNGKGAFLKHFIPGLFAPENVKRFANEIDILKEESMKMPDQGITAALAGMKVREDNTGLLDQFQFPVAFIAGKKDERIPFDTITEQAKLAKHSELLLLESVGHMGMIEETEKVLSFVFSFFRRCYKF